MPKLCAHVYVQALVRKSHFVTLLWQQHNEKNICELGTEIPIEIPLTDSGLYMLTNNYTLHIWKHNKHNFLQKEYWHFLSICISKIFEYEDTLKQFCKCCNALLSDDSILLTFSWCHCIINNLSEVYVVAIQE